MSTQPPPATQPPRATQPRQATPPRQATQPGLAIDWTRCDGHGLCAALLPASISRDDWGYPVLDADRLGREPVRELNRAVSICPALALRRVP